MNEGVLAIEVYMPRTLPDAENTVIEVFTEAGYTIDESAGDPRTMANLLSYVFVREDKRLNVVLSGDEGNNFTSVSIVKQ
jgi:hypothetical protein